MALQLDGPLLLIGAGKMGGALIEGWLARGLDPANVWVQDPAPLPDVKAMLEQHGIAIRPAVEQMPAAPAVLMLAVKPQVMEQVVPPLAKLTGPGTLIVSIAAGRTVASLARHFRSGQPIIRAMPNTPAAIGRGITGVFANPAVSAAQRHTAEALLAAAGEVAWLDDEQLINAVTAVSGSGPAYVFLLAECLAEAGRAAGLEASLAMRLARATVAGAGELLHRSELPASVLRQNVTSPGGTTAAALAVLMEEGGLQPLLSRAVAAAHARAGELSS